MPRSKSESTVEDAEAAFAAVSKPVLLLRIEERPRFVSADPGKESEI